jgi:DNA-binding ferritin-like protein (Dps family)
MTRDVGEVIEMAQADLRSRSEHLSGDDVAEFWRAMLEFVMDMDD